MVKGREMRRESTGAVEDSAALSAPPDDESPGDDTAADGPEAKKKPPKEYEVSIILDIRKKDENGELQEFFSSEICYPNVNYGMVVITEQMLMQMERKFGNMGIMRAHQKGFGEMLEQFGIKLSEEVGEVDDD